MEFQIVKPSGTGIVLSIAAMCVLCVGMCVFFIIVSVSARSCTLSLSDNALDIRSCFYNTHLNMDDIQTEGMGMADYASLGITKKTNGISLPGLLVGWCRGKGKKYKAYVTDRNHILVLPTKKNYSILFSTTEGERILSEITVLTLKKAE